MSSEANTTTTTNDPALPPTDTTAGAEKPSTIPSAPEMPISSDKDSASPSKKHISLPSIPRDLRSLTNTADNTITHLNNLLKTPGGLASLLSTLNYSLYILSHLHANAPTRAALVLRLNSLLGRPSPKLPLGAVTPPNPTSPLLPLALTVADTRATLRLTGLIPLYVLLKSLIKSRNQQKDRVAYAIKLVQCLGYISFQGLENVSHLTNKTVISSHWTNATFTRLGGMNRMTLWACRGWLTGISAGVLNLAREAQVARADGSEYQSMSQDERREVDRKFWTELFVAASWMPMALHYSIEGGIGLNLGMIGVSGFLANVGNFLKAWEASR